MSDVTCNLKADIAPLARTWPNPDAARMWLKRHPQEGLGVCFDQQRAIYRLLPVADDAPTEAVAAKAPRAPRKAAKVKLDDAGVLAKQAAKLAAEVDPTTQLGFLGPMPGYDAKGAEVDIGGEAVAAELSANVTTMLQAEAERDAEAEAETTDAKQPVILVSDVTIVIRGLPMNASASAWAREMFKKTRYPIEVVGADGIVLLTVDKSSMDATKAKRSSGGKKPAGETGPRGNTAVVLNLATRPEGATRKDFAEASGVPSTFPWTMIVKDAAKRYGYDWEIIKGADRTATYYLRKVD